MSPGYGNLRTSCVSDSSGDETAAAVAGTVDVVGVLGYAQFVEPMRMPLRSQRAHHSTICRGNDWH
jgi:hypothetical protein